jgi:hypothetical protein
MTLYPYNLIFNCLGLEKVDVRLFSYFVWLVDHMASSTRKRWH